MDDKNRSKKSDENPFMKNLIAIIALLFAVIGIATCMVEYLSLICALIAVVLGIVVVIKKLDGKIFAIIAILLGFVGGFLGGRTTYSVLSAMWPQGPDVVYSDDCTGISNCIERASESGKDADRSAEAVDKIETCLREKGIDPSVDADDLADSEQEIYRECVLESGL